MMLVPGLGHRTVLHDLIMSSGLWFQDRRLCSVFDRVRFSNLPGAPADAGFVVGMLKPPILLWGN